MFVGTALFSDVVPSSGNPKKHNNDQKPYKGFNNKLTKMRGAGRLKMSEGAGLNLSDYTRRGGCFGVEDPSNI